MLRILKTETPSPISLPNAPKPTLYRVRSLEYQPGHCRAAGNAAGLSHARRTIIAYRDTYGPFHSLEEVDLVEGIGQACINKIRDLIIFE